MDVGMGAPLLFRANQTFKSERTKCHKSSR